MEKKLYNITDLGSGDGGKGTVVHKVATMKKAHTIVKRGGGQGQHGASNSRGEKFAFSHWGCGTLEGIQTYISSLMIISPVGMLNEALSLKYQCGIHNAFDLLTVDKRVLCATVYHGISSRLKELARGDNPRGTIGTGVGEAYRYLEHFSELAIRAGDLGRSDLKDILASVRQQIITDLSSIIEGEFLPSDREEAESEIGLLYSEKFFELATRRLSEAGQRAKIVDADYLRREILSRDGVVVVESSHGILTDHFHGFYPHVSAIRTLPCFTYAMLEEAGYDGQVVNIGVHRAYEIKHGAGPMPTDDPAMAESLLPGSHKDGNRYQGNARVGPLDLNLMRYAIEVCGGPSVFDGLAITWFDQIQKNGVWHVCDHYRNVDDPKYFTPSGAIRIRRGVDDAQIAYQEDLGKQLFRCIPEITTHDILSVAKQDDLYSLCASVLQENLKVPVRMVSFGPTERDKICK
jgi:adenylosuccinate synthase